MSGSSGVDLTGLSDAAKACAKKMQDADVNEACIRTFLAQHAIISSGSTGNIPDSEIEPVAHLDALEDLSPVDRPDLLKQTVVLKLNGGLGTGMGLHEAKSLLEVKDGKTFLDFTALQVRYLRERSNGQLRFMLMNSFSTVDGTREYLKRYPELHAAFDSEVQLMQNQVPKILQDTLYPAEWPSDPACEWAPPGHGDLYTALYGSGKLDELIAQGYKYMFVSNGDNLGATLDSRLLAYMEERGVEFMMEVCQRTESDKKGGHLAKKLVTTKDAATGAKKEKEILLLRESAQCPKEDEASFQDINKYSYFNTNNLWIQLPCLAKNMAAHGGTLPLPVIRNAKTVDPANADSPKVFQLETAMGSAIQLFEHSAAVVVPRDRFAPVKTCADLLSLRSDAYQVTPDFRLVLDKRCNGKPPTVDLDGKYYKFIQGFEKLLPKGVPSMVGCTRLTIKGPVQFGARDVLKGEVVIDNSGHTEAMVIEDDKVMDSTTVKA